MDDATLTKVCPVCREDYLTVFEVKLFRSAVCGHPVCSKCLITQGNAKLSLTKTVQWSDPEQQLRCLVCGVPSRAASWTDTSYEENILERESLIRDRVLSILNCDRKSYETTPAYNEFLEEREEIIYDLVFSDDEELKAQRQNYLKQYEVEFQQRILEASERHKLNERNWIRNIVEKEDVFYEIVSSRLHTNFKSGKVDKRKLVHKLRALNPQYFEQEEAASTTSTAPTGTHQQEQAATKLVELHANLPGTIIPNIDYFKLKRKPAEDKAALLRAGGHKKDRIATRTRQEAFAVYRL
eukprot:Gregarina_sp_Poly_1__5840@NODE_3078_length_1401_cov_196_742129_g1949_i0_p1_GENE_NODE_3078_length_1401_cov_196_742129_g1949_i0NODE_3078_length_1401_cov_196_742129_g1949_i0_p1_ORF_typecomplete_len318_score43_72MAT1/PF06391_13/9_3e18zfRING_5/PF14634_6/1_5e05zfRING_UBOX/PF13445_6/0_00046zfC3HC4_5/PF17121_5/0_00073zfC3HC4_2/PF13923_6/0_0093zfC3HC4/PF00097_25/0_0085DUF573/PF04504_14/0_016zfRING_2/PF13639_6/0_03DUF416/PF04222_12/0_025zfRING_4/PF14570_6/4_2zfRING_4/PF14570_6/1_1e02Folliculin/PF11704_8/0